MNAIRILREHRDAARRCADKDVAAGRLSTVPALRGLAEGYEDAVRILLGAGYPDPDVSCPTCGGPGCGDCMDEDAGSER